MGSDRSPFLLFQAIEEAIQHFPFVHWIVFLTQNAWDDIQGAYSSAHHPAISCCIVPEVIEMHEEPLLALRQKKFSSLINGLKKLKKNQIQGFVSTGNTGALIAGATLSIPLLPGVQRPALLATLPTQKGEVAIIDVGGNVLCKANHLMQFAYMGVAYKQCLDGLQLPRVGLLNIGIESKKGTVEVRRAYEVLQQKASEGKFIFVGNIEGRELFQGEVDVLVTDGFTGNVLIKTSEGIASFMLKQLKQVLTQLHTQEQQAIFEPFHRQFNHEVYNGALLCGVNKVAVKCHGQSSPQGLLTGIRQAIRLIQNNFIDQMTVQLKIIQQKN